MKRLSYVSCLLLLSLASAASAAEPGEAIAPTSSPIKLFDGDLDAFYTWLQDTKLEDPRNVFRVTDGMLHITGDGLGGLVTKNSYRDYHCVLECKWGPRTWQNRKDRTKDSGLLVHSIGPDGAYGGIWKHSIEVQIIEGGFGDFILVNSQSKDPVMPMSMTCEVMKDRDGESVWHKGGVRETFHSGRINWYGRDPNWEDKLGFRGKDDVESPDGKWTRFDVYCNGDRITTYVNGVLVNEGYEVQPAAGQLQLQTELAELFVRRWELWPVNGGPEPAAAEQ